MIWYTYKNKKFEPCTEVDGAQSVSISELGLEDKGYRFYFNPVNNAYTLYDIYSKDENKRGIPPSVLIMNGLFFKKEDQIYYHGEFIIS